MTARHRAVLLLLGCLMGMGLPGVGLAAQDVPPAEPPVERGGPVAGALEDPTEEESWGRPERYRAPTGLRMLTEVGTGLVTSVAGGAVLGLAGFGLCEVTGLAKDSFFGCYIPAVLVGMLGLVEGYGLGVWWGGELMGGDGKLAFSLLGATVGALGSILLGAVLVSNQTSLDSVFVALPVALGGFLGYELSQRSESPSLLPMLSVSARGTLVGLGGRF